MYSDSKKHKKSGTLLILYQLINCINKQSVHLPHPVQYAMAREGDESRALAMVVRYGFTVQEAEEALRSSGGDVNRAISELRQAEASGYTKRAGHCRAAAFSGQVCLHSYPPRRHADTTARPVPCSFRAQRGRYPSGRRARIFSVPAHHRQTPHRQALRLRLTRAAHKASNEVPYPASTPALVLRLAVEAAHSV